MESLGVVVGVVALALVIVWNFLQSKRIDGLQKRLEAIEKR
ncbi:hypothetical protein [Anaerobaca lacustris]|uniref:Uncharacterized protein n=1 Tax=Anaerobaca lacustris TaxID=3044600 RepID=A0AAW6U6M8_9BACT|nr:hypothetical protein [Sedimentisphaerales bacterium M17dextr]